MVLQQARGADLVILAVPDQSAGADGIAARPGIRSIEDLRKRRVGVPKGTYSEYLLNVVVRRQGISLADVSLVEMLAEAAPAVLASGAADAVVTFEPMLSEAVARAGGTRLWDSSRIPGISPAALATRRALVRERPDDVQRVLRVWHRATTFIETHRDEAYAIVARVNRRTPADVAALARLDRAMGRDENLSLFSYSEGFESIHGTARVMNDFLLKQGQVARRLHTPDFIDPRFLKALR